MIRLFTGYDAREAIGWHVFTHSLLKHARQPVQVAALAHCGLPEGSNAFTYSRFLVPYLCGYDGWAIFMDGADMLMRADIGELWAQRGGAKALYVVKHPTYKTQHPQKYVGSSMQCPNRSYERKNWASVMLVNCAHAAWRDLDLQSIEQHADVRLLQLRYWADDAIGELAPEWNVLADEGQPIDGAKVLHWTAGIPGIPAYRNSPGAAEWFDALSEANEVP